MPRKKLIRCSEFPYHITNRSNNREIFYLEKPLLWTIFLEVLREMEIQFKCEIHAFVLMSNHYHLIVSTPECNLGDAMKYLHREVARKANKAAGRINHFFGGRYKWTVIGCENYYWNAVKYVFRNPVKANICMSVEDYRFSSLNSGEDVMLWKLTDFFNDRTKSIELDLGWLNESFTLEADVAIQHGLRRREFSLPRNQFGKMTILDAVPLKKGTVT